MSILPGTMILPLTWGLVAYTLRLTRKSRVQATMGQHRIRVTFFGVQFATAYILMLLAMYYNGYIIGVRYPFLPVHRSLYYDSVLC
jgi:glucose uptake protein GlcU